MQTLLQHGGKQKKMVLVSLSDNLVHKPCFVVWKAQFPKPPFLQVAENRVLKTPLAGALHNLFELNTCQNSSF